MANDEQHYLYKTHNLKRDSRWKVETESALSGFLQKLPTRFHATGTLYGHYTMELALPDTTAIAFGSLYDPNVEEILRHATVSALHENVTKKGEFTPEQVKIQNPNLYSEVNQTVEQSLVESVKFLLPPGFLGKHVSCRFHKLALYEPGDVPSGFERVPVHDSDHIATLLVEVRSPHTGGDLVLVKDGIEIRWSLLSEDSPSSHLLRWMMFYTDVDYRVDPVTSGVLIFLQYDVFHRADYDEAYEKEMISINRFDGEQAYHDIFEKAKPLPLATDREPPQLDVHIMSQMCRYLQQELLSPARVFAIPLYSLYTTVALSPEQLTPFDAVVYQALLEHDFGIALVPAELTAISDLNGYFDGQQARAMMNIFDFPLVIRYRYGDQETREVQTFELPAWPYDLSLVYCASGMESVSKLEKIRYAPQAGTAPRKATNRYLVGVMILFPLPLPLAK